MLLRFLKIKLEYPAHPHLAEKWPTMYLLCSQLKGKAGYSALPIATSATPLPDFLLHSPLKMLYLTGRGISGKGSDCVSKL